MKVIASFNDKVRVHLSEKGEKMFIEQGYKHKYYRKADGSYSFHLHEIANIFGSEMQNGASLPFETTFFEFELS